MDLNSVTPIDTATNTPGIPIPVGNNPDGIAITPNGTTAYVVDNDSNAVTPIDTATNTTGTAIPVGSSPTGIAITPHGKTAYVSSTGSDDVTPISTATNTAGTPIPVGNSPLAISITPDQAPTASFTVAPAPVGSPTSFDASASGAHFGSIATYAWNFGDGTTATTHSATFNHTYAAPGSYAVTLTVTDSSGTSTTQVFTGQTMTRNGGPSATTTHTVTISGSPSQGYDEVAADGGVFTYGNAGFFGSQADTRLNAPVVGMAATPDGKGYWLVAADGGVFTHGDAGFFGSQASTRLDAPVVGMAATPDGKGYWLVAADGAVFAHGDAGFFGSQSTTELNAPMAGMAATPDGKGLLAGGGGRRGVHLRRRRLLRLRRPPPISTPRWWAWRPPPTGRATGWWPRTAGCSPTETPASLAPWRESP